MVPALFRTVVVYVTVVAALRLMGKRQLGELQPSELVTTLMVSNVASICIDEPDLPLFASLSLILLLTVLEIFSSTLACLNPAYARLLFGKPITVIRNGEIVQSALPQLRITAGDLLEALRGKDIFSPADVLWAGPTGISVPPRVQGRSGPPPCFPFWWMIPFTGRICPPCSWMNNGSTPCCNSTV